MGVFIRRRSEIRRKIYHGVCLSVALFCFLSQARAGDDCIVIENFEDGLRPQWEAIDFKDKTRYSVIPVENGHALKAESSASATGLMYPIEYDIEEYPILTWRWKVENVLNTGNAEKKEGDDFSARIYVIFPHWFKPFTKSINYIWANKVPRGEHITNTFYSRAIMIAVQSGNENVGLWIMEKRNVYEDYRMLFGDKPPRVAGIAIMTDTDNTGESAVAYYDDIMIERRIN